MESCDSVKRKDLKSGSIIWRGSRLKMFGIIVCNEMQWKVQQSELVERRCFRH